MILVCISLTINDVKHLCMNLLATYIYIWHHWLHGRKSEWTLGVGDGQGGLASCNSWGRKESDWVTEVKWSEVKSLSCVWLFATPWTVAYQAFPSMGFSRQEYWSGLPFPSPGDFPDPGIRPRDRTQVSHIAGTRFNLWNVVVKWKIILSWTVKSLSSYPISKLKSKLKYWQKI